MSFNETPLRRGGVGRLDLEGERGAGDEALGVLGVAWRSGRLLRRTQRKGGRY